MLEQTLRAVDHAISGERALQNVRGIAQFHRVPASPGYRDAAAYCARLLADEPLRVETLRYAAREGISYLTQPMFREWHCRGARLELTEPESILLADFEADPLCVVQRSSGANFPDTPLDIVLMDKGNDERAYRNVDLSGRLLFVPGPPEAFLPWAVKERGARGLITDYMSDVFVRQRGDQYDSRLYLSFRWFNSAEDTKTFCFVLPPRLGDRLRRLCTEMAAAHRARRSLPRYPRARGFLAAEFKDGTIENVSATIPGQTDEEVLLVAHLCHGRACANDNASGCGGGIEIVRTLARLIRQGELPAPRRSIRLLLVPEVVGTFAYAATNEKKLALTQAGLCLDMIGRRQEGESGLVGLFGVPDSAASFVTDLAAHILDEYSRDIPTFRPDSAVTPVNIRCLDYVGGSDHYVLCDPTIGVPTVVMMQWLDSNYHCSADTPEQLDPRVLRKTCSIAAAYIYTLANLEPEDLAPVLARLLERFTRSVLQAIHARASADALPGGIHARIAYLQDVCTRAARDCLRFFSGSALERAARQVDRATTFIDESSARLLAAFDLPASPREQKLPRRYRDAKYQRIPVRRVRGPVSIMGFVENLPANLRLEHERLQTLYPEFFGWSSMNEFILHRVDGTRTVLEIARSAAQEGKRFDPEYVRQYLTLLNRAGLVEWVGEE